MRKLATIAIAATLVLALAIPASASHTHVMQTGNGSCVVLAANGGEKRVQLPHAGGAENRRHPLHVNVHLGEPGTRNGVPVIWVAGSDGAEANCPDYVNQ